MVCNIIAGVFRIQKTGLPAYIAQDGDMYTCGLCKDQATNITNVVGIY